MMNWLKISVVLTCLVSVDLPAQEFELIGLLDNNLVKIDSLSGQATIFKEIQNLAQGTNLADLTFHQGKNLFYSLKETSSSPSLVSISLEGDYQEVGQLTLNGNQIALVEAIAYNPEDNKLYAGVSLNGGVSNNDFYCESIVEVNEETGECIFLTEIATNRANPDIDVMTFIGSVLYMFDGAPPNANFLSFYQLEINNVSSSSNPTVIYESGYIPIRDFTTINGQVYFTEQRSLRRYQVTSNNIQFVGSTHQSSEFSGNIIQGISKLKNCELPSVDLGSDVITCDDFFDLDVTLSGSTYNWQDGSSTPTYRVTQSGTFWVDVDNSCGISRDTIVVTIQTVPKISLGEDRVTCDNLIPLSVSFPESIYEWQDGSNNSIYQATQTGTYWVNVENNCGVTSDSVELTFINTKDLKIPNAFTPNNDDKNDFFEIDKRIIGSQLKIFQRTGKLVYQSLNYQNDWSGSTLPSGTYYYILTDRCEDTYNGWVTILR